MDFTLSKYTSLLETIQELNIDVFGVSKWVKEKAKKGILIRHDVDRFPKRSLIVAQLEAEHKLFTTYYFRITRNSFNPEIIRRIAKLGHEIGYHYEDLSLANGDLNKAEKLFKEHLDQLRKYAKIKTIAMHGRPMSKFDNRDLWKRFDFAKYGIESEAFLSIDYKDIFYFTDTGRSWSNKAINLRDKTESLKAEVKSTDELIKFIKNNKTQKIAIVSHPERWNDAGAGYLQSYLLDVAANTIKRLLRRIYKFKK